MNEPELRALIRDRVARQLARVSPAPQIVVERAAVSDATRPNTDFSHAMYVTLVNIGDACLIEPAVPCNHCGFCKSHGH